jgi:hypothetical protein
MLQGTLFHVEQFTGGEKPNANTPGEPMSRFFPRKGQAWGKTRLSSRHVSQVPIRYYAGG